MITPAAAGVRPAAVYPTCVRAALPEDVGRCLSWGAACRGLARVRCRVGRARKMVGQVHGRYATLGRFGMGGPKPHLLHRPKDFPSPSQWPPSGNAAFDGDCCSAASIEAVGLQRLALAMMQSSRRIAR